MSQFALSTASPGPMLPAPLATSSPLTRTPLTISPPSAAKCCDTGRILCTDPISGHAVCTCQYGSATHMLAYQRLTSGLTSGLPLLYGADSPYLQALQGHTAPPAPGKDGALSLTPSLGAPGWPYSLYYPYGESGLAPYGLSAGYGFGLDGSRRKNATRETTSTLKAWLNEHKKNPYPTKGEKIMLAIITKMTLTQVSTWFANARRRLKKENKMTWEPRNRTDDDDDNSDAEAKSDDDTKPEREGSPAAEGSAEDGGHTCGSPPAEGSRSPVKPRIWSLADLAMSGSSPSRLSHFSPAAFLPPALTAAGGGKIMLPFARPHHLAMPYGRPEAAAPPASPPSPSPPPAGSPRSADEA